jgi:hypothetical protein
MRKNDIRNGKAEMKTKANIGQELLKQMDETSAKTPMVRIIERDAG